MITSGKLWYKKEIPILFLIAASTWIASIHHVGEVVSIWNQNDELGAWQGAAWLLGLDWSEVVSQNNFYGHGYGFLLAPFLLLFGNNTILMTRIAICFQALMHSACLFIAWYCIRRLFPDASATERIIGSTVCIMSIPDLFYNYFFFSESILRVIIWGYTAFLVSYYYKKKWYKLLVLGCISVFAFSVHQRCILLLAWTILILVFEIICNHRDRRIVLGLLFAASIIVLFYCLEYKLLQGEYIGTMYSRDGKDSVGGNLLSERGITLSWIIKDILLNAETHGIAVQNTMGMVYYIGAIDCGLFFWGIIFCLNTIKQSIVGRKELQPQVLFMFLVIVTGVLLTSYINTGDSVYERVEIMHYGRYCSYLFPPMIMLGVMHLITKRDMKPAYNSAFVILMVYLIGGISTSYVLKTHDVNNLFAFRNACPGIANEYLRSAPYDAVMYYTQRGAILMTILFMAVTASRAMIRHNRIVLILPFVFFVSLWTYVADKEALEQYNMQKAYVESTYDLQKVLNEEKEFIAYKSYSYGSGLLQYNNPFSKVNVRRTLEEFGDADKGLLVVSQKGIDDIGVILGNYPLEYENERYIIWRYI